LNTHEDEDTTAVGRDTLGEDTPYLIQGVSERHRTFVAPVAIE
jgi:hypothetical protein